VLFEDRYPEVIPPFPFFEGEPFFFSYFVVKNIIREGPEV